jgi:hypothetical protein
MKQHWGHGRVYYDALELTVERLKAEVLQVVRRGSHYTVRIRLTGRVGTWEAWCDVNATVGVVAAVTHRSVGH